MWLFVSQAERRQHEMRLFVLTDREVVIKKFVTWHKNEEWRPFVSAETFFFSFWTDSSLPRSKKTFIFNLCGRTTTVSPQSWWNSILWRPQNWWPLNPDGPWQMEHLLVLAVRAGGAWKNTQLNTHYTHQQPVQRWNLCRQFSVIRACTRPPSLFSHTH